MRGEVVGRVGEDRHGGSALRSSEGAAARRGEAQRGTCGARDPAAVGELRRGGRGAAPGETAYVELGAGGATLDHPAEGDPVVGPDERPRQRVARAGAVCPVVRVRQPRSRSTEQVARSPAVPQRVGSVGRGHPGGVGRAARGAGRPGRSPSCGRRRRAAGRRWRASRRASTRQNQTRPSSPVDEGAGVREAPRHRASGADDRPAAEGTQPAADPRVALGAEPAADGRAVAGGDDRRRCRAGTAPCCRGGAGDVLAEHGRGRLARRCRPRRGPRRSRCRPGRARPGGRRRSAPSVSASGIPLRRTR